MNLKKTRFAFVASVAAAGIAVTTAAVAGTVPTYQEFSAATFKDADGQYIVNGDEPVGTQGDLRKFYERMVSPEVQEDGLIINTVGGADDKWSASQVGNLTYCVSNNFGTRKADVVRAMESGAALWENASSAVDYVYVPSQDASCNTRNRNVVFSVEPVQTTQYIARAFFPSSSKRSRNVLIDDSFWSMSYTQTNVIAHELGHTLGFRHEHTRPESGTCFEDNNWRELTPYDKNSIMHYPQCNGVAGQLSFSTYDAQGVRAVYGS